MEGNTAAAAEPRSVLPQAALSLVLCIALAGASLFSLWVGAQDIGIATIMASFTAYDAENVQEMIVQTLRFPRLLAALTCGASFAVAGAIMQGVTNNPMASPSILGINAGSGFGLAVAMILFPQGSLGLSLVFSFAGAAIATLAIFLLAQTKGAGRGAVFLALAGTAIGAVFAAVTQAMTVYFEVAQDMSYWTAGGISGVRMEQALFILPWTFAGLLLAMGIARSVTLLAFGEEGEQDSAHPRACGHHGADPRWLGGRGRGSRGLRGTCDATYRTQNRRNRLPQGDSALGDSRRAPRRRRRHRGADDSSAV